MYNANGPFVRGQFLECPRIVHTDVNGVWGKAIEAAG